MYSVINERKQNITLSQPNVKRASDVKGIGATVSKSSERGDLKEKKQGLHSNNHGGPHPYLTGSKKSGVTSRMKQRAVPLPTSSPFHEPWSSSPVSPSKA